ncbi:MAG: DUF5011 domain-containing protein [Chitinophagales bacterium]
MKKYVLSMALASLAVGTILAGDPRMPRDPKARPITQNVKVIRKGTLPATSSSASRSLRSLDKAELSTAGNLYTVLNSGCNQIITDDATNAAVFIHRSDVSPATCCGGSNIAQYRYDISRDGGQVWTPNLGVLNPLANNTDYSSRYPQAAFYKPTGATSIDSMYMAYTGTWHNGATNAIWYGEAHGVAQLSDNHATYKSSRDTINGGNLTAGFSFVQGAPGKYFSLNYDFHDQGNNIYDIGGLILIRGVWVDSLKNVSWSNQKIAMNVAKAKDASGNDQSSLLNTATIAFDPTGQYGWIIFKSDMEEDDYHVMRLYAMKSDDYGDTWSAPQEIKMNEIQGMMEDPYVESNGTAIPVQKSIEGDIDIAVDYQGQVHIGAIVYWVDSTNASYDTYIPSAGLYMYDIYHTGTSGCEWKSHFFHEVYALTGEYTVASGSDAAVDEGNRMQSSRTEDGKKIFFFWNDTDSSLAASQTSSTNNVSPNLFGVGINLDNQKVTDMINFTAGDDKFGGQVGSTTPEGEFGGSLFPVVSVSTFTKSNYYNVPVVLTQPDYRNTGSNKLGGNPAKFFICKNIDFPFSGFTKNFDNVIPDLSLIGPDTMYILVGTAYTDSGVVASKCGTTLPTPTYGSNVNKDSVGVYTVTYSVTDNSNNTATVTRTVIVSSSPVAIIRYKQNWGNNFIFRDSSLYFPTSRRWTWGDNTGKTNVTIFNKTYSTAGTKMVTLEVSNQFGTDRDTVYVNVALGIEDEAFAGSVSVSPNPSKGTFVITAPEDQPLEVTAYDVTGKAVTAKTPLTKSNGNGYIVDLNALSTGLYLLKIENGKSMTVKQISIIK